MVNKKAEKTLCSLFRSSSASFFSLLFIFHILGESIKQGIRFGERERNFFSLFFWNPKLLPEHDPEPKARFFSSPTREDYSEEGGDPSPSRTGLLMIASVPIHGSKPGWIAEGFLSLGAESIRKKPFFSLPSAQPVRIWSAGGEGGGLFSLPLHIYGPRVF